MMWGLPFKDIDYCKNGMPYRKRTRIWNNIFNWNPKPLCKKDCWAIDETGRKHVSVAHKGPNKTYPNNAYVQGELYRIPADVIRQTR